MNHSSRGLGMQKPMNQTPEQIARDNIDKKLTACGWIIQDIKQVNI